MNTPLYSTNRCHTFRGATKPTGKARCIGGSWRIAALPAAVLPHRMSLYDSVRSSLAPCAASKHERRGGFTIVELIIAATVFSVLLLLVSFGLIQIGRTYYKGVTASRTQEAARSIMDDVSQSIQLSSGDLTNGFVPGNDSGFYCIGSRRYSFVLGRQLSDNPGSNQTRHALVKDTSCDNTIFNMNSTSLIGTAKELLTPGMRLAELRITKNDDLYQITIRVVTGDDDLLCSPSMAGTCDGSVAMQANDYRNADLTCRGGAGSQFCALSDLETAVQQRVVRPHIVE